MKFNLLHENVPIGINTLVPEYELPIQETGSLRGTLVGGDIVEIEGKLVEITDYTYSYILNKGIYLYKDLEYYVSNRIY